MPVNFQHDSGILQRRQITDNRSACRRNHIAAVTDKGISTISTMLDPAILEAVIGTRAFIAGHWVIELDIRHLSWCAAWKATDIKDMDIPTGRVNDIQFFLIG